MNPYQFCQTQIGEWTEISRRASENANLARFKQAEKEIANYQVTQKRYETEGNDINKGG